MPPSCGSSPPTTASVQDAMSPPSIPGNHCRSRDPAVRLARPQATTPHQAPIRRCAAARTSEDRSTWSSAAARWPQAPLAHVRPIARRSHRRRVHRRRRGHRQSAVPRQNHPSSSLHDRPILPRSNRQRAEPKPTLATRRLRQALPLARRSTPPTRGARPPPHRRRNQARRPCVPPLNEGGKTCSP